MSDSRSISEPMIPGAPLRVVRITDWSAAEALRAGWEALLQERSATIFQTWEWMTSWWHAYGRGCELCLLAFYDGEQLVALAPLYYHGPTHALRRRPRSLRLIGDRTGDSANLDMLYVATRHAEVSLAFVDWLRAHRHTWDSFEMEGVPTESVLLSTLRAQLSNAGWLHRGRESPHLIIALPATWEELVGRLSRLGRRNIRHARRQLNKKFKVKAYRCETVKELRYFLDALYRMHTERWQVVSHKGVFRSPARLAFYEAVSESLLLSGKLYFWLLELDGHRVSAQFSLRFGRTITAVQTGWNPAFAPYSVGQVMWSHVLESAIGEGYSVLDLGEGDNPYKIGWTPERHTFTTMKWFRPRSRGSLLLRAHALLEGSREGLRAVVPAWLWAMVRGAVRRFVPYRNPIEEPETTL
jgi:CelD/BcsL family acetyltransferase involved in cellulose biosynthesis